MSKESSARYYQNKAKKGYKERNERTIENSSRK